MRVPRADPSKPQPRTRKSLNANALIATVRESFETLPDARWGSVTVPMGDVAMSAFAMFSAHGCADAEWRRRRGNGALEPSLLSFDKRRQKGDPNLHSIFKTGIIPCDTQMREALDPVDPEALQPAFKALFNQAQRGKALEPFCFLDQGPLNQSNLDVLVTFVEYWQDGPKDTKHFAWVIALKVTTQNVYEIMRGGRARWRIENETFNTLKNQGYHLEHNYGLGQQNLSAVFACTMMLAFFIDQLQQLCCKLFQAAWAKLGSKQTLWETIRSMFRLFLFDAMTDLLRHLVLGERVPLLPDTS